MKVEFQPMAVDRLPGAGPKAQGPVEEFAEVLKKKVTAVDDQLKAAGQATEDYASGRSNRLHELMMSVEEADLSLKMLLQVRTKALEAYREISRMNM